MKMEKDFDKDHDPDPDFVKGFNEGYVLAQYAPEIGGVFGAYAPESERGKGFRDGKSQFALEPRKERTHELRKDASDNKRDIREGKEWYRDSVFEEFNDNRFSAGIANADKHIGWLEDLDESKSDMDIHDREDRERSDVEPDIE